RALAARMSALWACTAWAAPTRAACLRSAEAVASLAAAARALRPSASIMVPTSSAITSARLISRLLLGPDQHQVVTVHQFGAGAHPQQVLHHFALLAHHQPGIVAVETGKAAGKLAAVGVDDRKGIAALELADDAGHAHRQQRAALPQR